MWRMDGRAGVAALSSRIADAGRVRPRAWFAAIVLIPVAVMAFAYVAMRLCGIAVPQPRISFGPALGLFAAFLISGFAEELGWTGYATDPMLKRFGAPTTALVIGAVWAAWHIVPLMQAGRPAVWIAWWSLATIAARALMVWLYVHAGRSVFALALFHAVQNLTWQLFPVHGSFYDPRFFGPIMAAAALIAITLRSLRSRGGAADWRPTDHARARRHAQPAEQIADPVVQRLAADTRQR